MGCGSCSSQGCTPAGCKGNGGCSSGGCNKMNSYDWLQDMEDPQFFPKFDVVEIRFKGGRKEFYKNKPKLELVIGDALIVDVQGGKHLGYVSLTGELVRLQMKKRKVENDNQLKNIIRIANDADLEKAQRARDREGKTIFRAREIIRENNLKMKLSDVEYQADNTKAIFYYSADERVDFRELIKGLAGEFNIRVEMKQISIRHEAARLGGIGSCGRELCCSTWLSDFKTVGTQAARYQNLSINPQKLSGQCGRLKCCLNYELDTYKSALKDIPNIKKPLKTTAGEARLVKTDIFKQIMWFSFPDESEWKPLGVAEVKRIIELNQNGEKGEFKEKVIVKKVIDFVDETVNLEGNLSRLDSKKPKKKSNNKKRNNNNNNNRNKANENNPNHPSNKTSNNKKANENNPNHPSNKSNEVNSNKNSNRRKPNNKNPNNKKTSSDGDKK